MWIIEIISIPKNDWKIYFNCKYVNNDKTERNKWCQKLNKCNQLPLEKQKLKKTVHFRYESSVMRVKFKHINWCLFLCYKNMNIEQIIIQYIIKQQCKQLPHARYTGIVANTRVVQYMRRLLLLPFFCRISFLYYCCCWVVTYVYLNDTKPAIFECACMIFIYTQQYSYFLWLPIHTAHNTFGSRFSTAEVTVQFITYHRTIISSIFYVFCCL